MALTIREVGNVIIFDIDGDLTVSTIEDIALHRRVKEMLAKGQGNVLVNFAKVTFIDSSGVGDFLASFVSIQNAGEKLKIEKLPPKIRVVFEITGIIGLFESGVFEDEETAIKSFS
jgi:anti-anti-sigma factor